MWPACCGLLVAVVDDGDAAAAADGGGDNAVEVSIVLVLIVVFELPSFVSTPHNAGSERAVRAANKRQSPFRPSVEQLPPTLSPSFPPPRSPFLLFLSSS